MNKEKRAEIYRLLAAERPNPKSELDFTSPYELLVAVVLSAQATDKSVNIATKVLFAKANTPEAMLALGVEKIEECIRSIGLYKAKAANVHKAAKILVEEYGSRVPENFDDLVRLPGVGSKTASVVLNVAFGHPTIAVDTHIFRVANRSKLAVGKTPEEVMGKLLRVTPREYLVNAHHWLLLHGRYCCKARKPECGSCPIVHLCEYREKILPGE